MHSLADFQMSHMIEGGQALRALGEGAESMEEVANRIVDYLYGHFGDPETGERDCTLVRFYKTHAFGDLDPDQQAFARGVLKDDAPPPEMKCLTLVASTGDNPDWRVREASVGHKAIPLPSKQFVEKIPMISRLIQQFGFEMETVLSPDPRFLLDADQKTYNVFYVPDARGSPYVPAQEDFVEPYGVESALGFGGMLPTGDLYAVILFTKVPVRQTTAELFRTLSLSVKLAVLPFARGPVFAQKSAS